MLHSSSSSSCLLCSSVYNAANVNKLFLGLYFCQSSVAQKKVKDASSHSGVQKRGRSKLVNNLLITRKSILARDLQTSLLEKKVTTALEHHHNRLEKESAKDTLAYFKKQVVKNGLKKMGKNDSNTPLLGRSGRRAISPNMRGARRGVTPPQSLQRQRGGDGPATPMKKVGVHSPADRGSKSFVERKVMLDSVTSYRKTVQNYKIPRSLINLSAYSQLDSNSIFANQLR